MDNNRAGLLLISLSLITVLTISGCTFPGIGTGFAGDGGVIIENFKVDFPRVYSGEEFKIQMKMRNNGLVDALNVQPKLYNIQGWDSVETLTCEIGEVCSSQVTLLGADPDVGTIGESKICIWDCRAPKNINKGLSVTFNPSVRLFYDYETYTIKSINIVSQDELRSIEAQGKALPSETISTSSGPVSLDVVVNGPIRYWDDDMGNNKIKFPINININNMGGGVAFLPASDAVPETWNKIELLFEKNADNVNLECNGQLTEKTVVELWKGSTTTLTCEVEISKIQEMAGVIQKNLKFSVNYGYFVDSSAELEVIGRDTN